MKQCPECKSERFVKNGSPRGEQRYLCKDCKYNFTKKQKGHPLELKAKVIEVYLEGVGIRALGRIFRIGAATVLRWIREYAHQLPEPEKPAAVTVMEIDEMHHWIKEKKTLFGSGLRFAAVQVGYLPGSWVIVEHQPLRSSGRS